MSTKSTIAWDETFELYHEMADDWAVWLKLTNAQFEATPDGVTVRIPARAWKEIRSHPSDLEKYLDMPPEDLRREAEASVDERIEKYKQNKAESNAKLAGLLSLVGYVVYGDINLPREEQIENYIQWHTEKKTHD